MRALRVLPAGSWAEEPIDQVTLDYDGRWRRRIALTGAGGTAFLLDLAEATELRDGDGLALEDGGVVCVRAADEPVIDIACAGPRDLARIAWHLGNRHLPVQITESGLRIRQDHVIADMLRGLGAEITPLDAPFDPEGGAYGRGRTHGHSHG
mgnify:CR=1 FL=1